MYYFVCKNVLFDKIKYTFEIEINIKFLSIKMYKNIFLQCGILYTQHF